MAKQQSDLDFRIMALSFKVRDLIRPRSRILGEAGIKPGFQVLDFGCGPGSYIAPLARLVGESGKIYALDINPLAIKKVRDIAARKKLTNVATILSDRQTGLPDNALDTVLLYDTFHDLSDPDGVLKELHRVLKPEGVLSFSDHHMEEETIISGVTGSGLFGLLRKGERVYNFSKIL